MLFTRSRYLSRLLKKQTFAKRISKESCKKWISNWTNVSWLRATFILKISHGSTNYHVIYSIKALRKLLKKQTFAKRISNESCKKWISNWTNVSWLRATFILKISHGSTNYHVIYSIKALRKLLKKQTFAKRISNESCKKWISNWTNVSWLRATFILRTRHGSTIMLFTRSKDLNGVIIMT